jgi:hypothetical protein
MGPPQGQFEECGVKIRAACVTRILVPLWRDRRSDDCTDSLADLL